MVDIYGDNISLEKIQQTGNEQMLIFKNKEKDETLALLVSEDELLNIFQKVKMRCEILTLIPVTNFGRKEQVKK